MIIFVDDTYILSGDLINIILMDCVIIMNVAGNYLDRLIVLFIVDLSVIRGVLLSENFHKFVIFQIFLDFCTQPPEKCHDFISRGDVIQQKSEQLSSISISLPQQFDS